jgi:hypothetical protein
VTAEEINGFLETFFKLYPSASDKELAYYVSNNALPVINKNYIFEELMNPTYIMVDNQVETIVTVKYLDQETKVAHLSQCELVLKSRRIGKLLSEDNVNGNRGDFFLLF